MSYAFGGIQITAWRVWCRRCILCWGENC